MQINHRTSSPAVLQFNALVMRPQAADAQPLGVAIVTPGQLAFVSHTYSLDSSRIQTAQGSQDEHQRNTGGLEVASSERRLRVRITLVHPDANPPLDRGYFVRMLGTLAPAGVSAEPSWT